MKLSIVIPAYNEERMIAPCLVAVEKAVSYARLGPEEYEIIVVNNASTDRTREIALGFQGVKVVDEPNKGLTRARQAGFLAAHGELIANPDADTRMPRGWIVRALREFDRDGELMALSGPYRYYDLPFFARVLTHLYNACSFASHLINTYILRLGATVQGGNFVLRRAALVQIGGFDTSIEFYGEDTDIAKRISQIGKVRWIWPFFMYSSGRRFVAEGIVTIGIRYALNYMSVIFSGRPVTVSYIDIRDNQE